MIWRRVIVRARKLAGLEEKVSIDDLWWFSRVLGVVLIEQVIKSPDGTQLFPGIGTFRSIRPREHEQVAGVTLVTGGTERMRVGGKLVLKFRASSIANRKLRELETGRAARELLATKPTSVDLDGEEVES